MQSQSINLQPLTVTTRLAQALGGIAVIVLAPLVFVALSSSNIPSALLFLALAAVGIFLMYTASGVIEMDAESISLRRRNRLDRIRWDEVILFETAGDTIIFNGEDKCLVLIEPLWWRGTDRAAMLQLMGAQMMQRELPQRYNLLATLKQSRNTRVA